MKLCIIVLALTGCSSGLTKKDRGDLTMYETELLRCQAEGRDAGTYAAYEACKKDAGL